MGQGGDSTNPQEFTAEAEEILESIGRDLQAAEEEAGAGGVRIQRLNSLFRAIHSLKGLAGMFGRSTLTTLTHRLEDFLDRLRMGEAQLDGPALDLLFDAHERLEQLVGQGPAGEDEAGDLLARIDGVLAADRSSAAQPSAPGGAGVLLDSHSGAARGGAIPRSRDRSRPTTTCSRGP
jgi:two-component system chemotaxis sensor kinase CheA